MGQTSMCKYIFLVYLLSKINSANSVVYIVNVVTQDQMIAAAITFQSSKILAS